MNTQMRKLAEQAGKWVCENEPRSMDDDELFRELYMEKFAQLIVAHATECVRDVLRDEKSDLSYAAASQVQDRIKEHFGVEE